MENKTALTAGEVIQRLADAFPEGTVLEFGSGSRRIIVGFDRSNGTFLTQTLPHADGSMPPGPRLCATSITQILKQYEITCRKIGGR
jgi:hypothetical protein